jgi:signal transduction histidine kinase
MDLDDLRGLFLFDGVSDDQLRELIAAGKEVGFDEGTELFREGDPADFWWVLLDGRVDLVRRAGREEAVVMLTMDRPGVWAGGFQAWNPSSSYLATARSASAGRMLQVPSETLGDLTRAWFPFGVHLIEGFFQTVRSMDSLSRQREALIALGRLAAGLAHEMNNPAAATARAIDELGDTCQALLAALVRLAERSLLAEQFVAIDALRREIDPSTASSDPLAVADLEEALSDWLARHEVENSWHIAPALAAAGVDVRWCERAAEILHGDTLEPGLEWVAGTLSTQALLSEMKESTGRISALVDAVKSYSQLDRASLQLVDVTEGIESTLVMLRHKLRDDITVVRDYSADAPSVEANPGELNQVWTNLIDNAIDAIEGRGTLRISTRLDGEDLVVEIGDTGPGMPPAVQARAFEPFFTTKDVGKGTGLGLDISRRIVVDRHHGQITIDSRPDETVLSVRLPSRPA